MTQHLRAAAIFTDGMVLQRDKPLRIFGTGKTGRSVTAQLSLEVEPARAVVTATTVVQPDGAWSLSLAPLGAGGPYVMSLTDGEATLEYREVFVGEVWLAGGQSNMELALIDSLDGQQAVAASTNPNIHLYVVPKSGWVDDDFLATERATSWATASPETTAHASAVAYCYARRLQEQLGVHVGIIDCYCGGTSISCWMSEGRLRSTAAGQRYLTEYGAKIWGQTDADYERIVAKWQVTFDGWNAGVARIKAEVPDVSWEAIEAKIGACPWPPPAGRKSMYRPAGLFTTMVERVAGYSLRGVLWYQGEEDESRASDYRTMLDGLLAEWQEVWGDEALPFVVTQLPRWISKADYDAGADSGSWATIRAAQAAVARETASTYLTVILDCGEFNNIHPVDKATVGERMALTALAHVYEDSSVASEGPRAVGAEWAGPGLVDIEFNHAVGLTFGHWNDESDGKDGDGTHRSAGASGFEVAEAGEFVPVAADIVGEKVALHIPKGLAPTSVRYGWKNWGPAPLFNGDHLPAAPFEAAIAR